MEGNRSIVRVLLLGVLFIPWPANALETAYWIWAGIEPGRLSAEKWQSSELFVHQGFIDTSHGKPIFSKRGLSPHIIPSDRLRIVYRLNGLPDAAGIAWLYQRQKFLWEREGNTVLGIQLDYDSPTPKLGRYAEFLKELRGDLPPGTELSITGLRDWLASSDPAVLSRLSDSVDFVAFMLYHGNQPLRPIIKYATILSRFSRNFRVGLLPLQADDRRLAGIAHAPGYLGAVVFLPPRDAR